MSNTQVESGPADNQQKLIDALIVPVVTPNDPSDDNILENLLEIVELELDPPSTLNMIKAVRKTVKSAESLIKNGEERKNAILYVCKVAVYKNVNDKSTSTILLSLIETVVPEVIEFAVDAFQNPQEYKKKIRAWCCTQKKKKKKKIE
jgi:hypothetical protein